MVNRPERALQQTALATEAPEALTESSQPTARDYAAAEASFEPPSFLVRQGKREARRQKC